MSPLPHVFALVTVVASIALLFAERAGSLTGIWIAKPIAALGFVLAAWAGGALTHDAGRVLFAGLILGLVGDVFLILKHDKRMFLCGLVAFLLGHLAYVVVFVMRGLDLRALGIATAVLLVPAVVVGRWLWPHAGRLRGPVLAYIAVITAMMATAIAVVAAGDTRWAVVGAALFYLSDLGVARERFVARAFINKLIGQPLYFGAQIILALALSSPPGSMG